MDKVKCKSAAELHCISADLFKFYSSNFGGTSITRYKQIIICLTFILNIVEGMDQSSRNSMDFSNCHISSCVCFICFIAYMLYQDIKLYFEDWVHWSPFEDRTDGIIRRRKELQQLLDEIKQLLISKAEGNNRNYFDYKRRY